MQHRLALKHVSGSRADKVDILAFPPECEIILGRDRECHVRYSETDELVSRKHLKIVVTGEKPVRYLVVDLGSRNGTFVNRQRVFGAVRLQPGARVQLGVGGPEFEFRLEQDAGRENATPARESKPGARGAAPRNAKAGLARRALPILLPLGAGFAAYLAWANLVPLWQNWRRAQSAAAAAPRFNAATALASVASVEAAWSVSEKQTGRRIERVFVRNERISNSGSPPFIDGAPGLLPAFVLLDDRRIEPLLVFAGTVPGSRPVGGKWTAKGLIVSATAAALAPAPARKPWTSAWSWTTGESAGALFVLESGKIGQVVPLAAAQFPRWEPANSGWLVDQFQQELHAEFHGRRLSSEDLRIDVAVVVTASGRTWNTHVEESSGFVLASPQPGSAPESIPVPPLDDGSAVPIHGQPVWIVSDQAKPGIIGDAAGSILRLSAPLCRDGGVLFDDEARVLAICAPDSRANACDIAVPIRRALDFFQGAAHGQSW